MKKTLGVVVGRFQVDVPTLAHNALINYAKERCDNVLILLGSREKIDIKNILNADIRYGMIKNQHHECIIKPIYDIDGDDVKWSEQLDTLIKDTIKIQLDGEYDVVLFGGRDSYIKYYSGEYLDTYVEVSIDEYKDISATSMRAEIASRIINDPVFRAGIIYGVTNYINQNIEK